MNFKNEINSRFMGDRTRQDALADLITKEFEALHSKVALLERTISIMQEAMVRMEIVINTHAGDINAKPKTKRRNKKD